MSGHTNISVHTYLHIPIEYLCHIECGNSLYCCCILNWITILLYYVVHVSSTVAVTLEVQDTEVEVSEGEGVARVCATMQGRADFPIRAVFTTAAGTATSADDYMDTPVEVVFPALDNSPRCADIPITDDSVLEFVEMFSVHLAISSPHHSKVNVGNSTVVTVTIIDDDCKLNDVC